MTAHSEAAEMVARLCETTERSAKVIYFNVLKRAITQGHPGTNPTTGQRPSLTTRSGAGWFFWVSLSIISLGIAVVSGLSLCHSHSQIPHTTVQTPFYTVMWDGTPVMATSPEELIQLDYNRYNLKYFKGKLPYAAIICDSTVSRASNTLGSTWWSPPSGHLIVIDKRLCDIDEKVWAPTLLHEMCHIKVGENTEKVSHGPLFHKEIQRILHEGAFDDLIE